MKKEDKKKNPAELPVVAAFDFDGTITYRDTLFPFLFYVGGFVKTVGKLLWLSPMLAGYVMGIVSRQETKERVLTSFFQGMSLEKLRDYGKKFVEEKMPRLLKPEALQRLRWHQEQGHRCVLVTASVDAYVEPWAKQAGFDDIISSKIAVDSGSLITGKLAGNNCWGVEKTRRLEALLGPRDRYCLYAYGDSRGDLEMLAFADYTYYRKIPYDIHGEG